MVVFLDGALLLKRADPFQVMVGLQGPEIALALAEGRVPALLGDLPGRLVDPLLVVEGDQISQDRGGLRDLGHPILLAQKR